MALPSSGTITLDQIHVEAGGTSGTQAGMNDSDIRALIGKNAGTQMSFSEWYGASASVTAAVTSNTTNRNASTIFGSDFTANVAKILIINSGVEVGASNLSNYAINVPSGMGGTLNIQNAGTLSGAGGDGATSSGQDGGDGGTAIYIASNNVTVTNTGTIRGGGGGGGKGATGATGNSISTSGVTCVGGSGGAGGNGGNGQGYDQSQSNGSGGGSPGARYSYIDDYPGNINAMPSPIICGLQGGNWGYGSAGSDGGNGGTYGQDGGDGGGSGSTQGDGGSKGKYIELASGISYTLSNSGTLQGNAP